MRLAMLVLFAALFAPACLPPVTCAPGVMRCMDDVPRVCSSTGREWAVSSPPVRCAEVGGVCAMRGDVAACVRPPAAPPAPAPAVTPPGPGASRGGYGPARALQRAARVVQRAFARIGGV